MNSAGSAGCLWLHSLCLQCIVPAVLVACGYAPCVCNVQCRECWLLVVTLLVFAMHSAGSAGCLWLHSLCLQCIVPAVLVACGYAPCVLQYIVPAVLVACGYAPCVCNA